MDTAHTLEFVEEAWEQDVLPALTGYIAIPACSPAFDAAWQQSGHIDRALDLIAAWVEKQALPRARIDIERLPGRTPLLTIEVPGEGDETVLRTLK